MRLASMLLIAACLTLSAQADGKPGRTRSAGPAPATSAPAPLDRAAERLTPAKSAAAGHEIEIYRFGGTYSVLAGTTVAACEATCGGDTSCKAWSFVDAYGAAGARCELKRSAGRKEENLLATSGLSPELKARFLGRPTMPDPVDRDQLLSEVAARPSVRLMATVPVLTYTPVQAPVEAREATAGMQLPMTQPSITFSPVMTEPAAAPALRYATATPDAKQETASGATVFYPNTRTQTGEAESTGYYPKRTADTSPAG